jgi:hypothetical protein
MRVRVAISLLATCVIAACAAEIRDALPEAGIDANAGCGGMGGVSGDAQIVDAATGMGGLGGNGGAGGIFGTGGDGLVCVETGPEVCDLRDSDCDGRVDEGLDGACTDPTSRDE